MITSQRAELDRDKADRELSRHAGYLADFLRAGPEFGATTLARFYAIHMLLVPGLIAALIGGFSFGSG